jgi:hypothetical protein
MFGFSDTARTAHAAAQFAAIGLVLWCIVGFARFLMFDASLLIHATFGYWIGQIWTLVYLLSAWGTVLIAAATVIGLTAIGVSAVLGLP